MDFHPKQKTLISRSYRNFIKLDHGAIGYEGIWFYAAPYYIEPWLDKIVIRLPRWINCSCDLEEEIIDALVGDHSQL